MELIVFLCMMIVALIAKSSQGAGKSSARPPVSRGEELRKLEDILSAEIERVKKRRSASQYEREQERQYQREFDRQEGYYPAEYRVEIQQPVSTKGSERKKEPAPEPPPVLAPAAPSTARLPKEGMQRAGEQREDNRRMQQQLVDLLGSERIALGILASEVLSSPRARRPFQYRR